MRVINITYNLPQPAERTASFKPLYAVVEPKTAHVRGLFTDEGDADDFAFGQSPESGEEELQVVTI